MTFAHKEPVGEDCVSLCMQPRPGLCGIGTLIPDLVVRPATDVERNHCAAWLQVNSVPGSELEVVEYGDGQSVHAPEVIDAYHLGSRSLPQDFVLIYLHRGVQIECAHPLLASLLFRTGHMGKSHALRQHGETDSDQLRRFAQAVTPSGGAALIIDDRQERIGPAGRISAAAITIYTFIPTDRLAVPTNGEQT